jgi:uncharacterized protein
VGLAGADVLVTFLKAPYPGAVKRRLAAGIGEELAAEVYRAIAEEEIRRTTPRGDEYQRLFFFAPLDARREIDDWLPDEVVHPQCEGDLGTRMARAFEDLFARGARRIALVGSDLPFLSRDDVREAFDSLHHHDVVLGPATDGGYYLIALERPQPELFRAVAWSTGTVLATTLERAAGLGLSVRVLPALGDVDTAEDLVADWTRLAPILPERLRAELWAVLFPSRG